MIIKSLKSLRFSHSYLNPLGRPIDSLALNSLIEATSQVLMFAHYQSLSSPFSSLFIGSMALRAFIEITGIIVDKWSYKKYGQRKLKTWIQKLFLVDLERDIKFYNVQHINAQFMRQYYTPSEVFKYFLNGYLCLNIARGFNYLINSPHCSQFISHSTLNLCLYDPSFLCPVVIMLLNYFLLKYSTHPFLVHLRNKTQIPYIVVYSFMTGLPFAGLPLAYNVGWIGFVSMHCIIRSIKKISQNYRKYRISSKFK